MHQHTKQKQQQVESFRRSNFLLSYVIKAASVLCEVDDEEEEEDEEQTLPGRTSLSAFSVLFRLPEIQYHFAG